MWLLVQHNFHSIENNQGLYGHAIYMIVWTFFFWTIYYPGKGGRQLVLKLLYNVQIEKSSLLIYISPQPTHFNIICTIQLFSFLRNILIWPAVSSYLSTLTVSEIGKRFHFVSVSLRKREVFLLLSLRGLTVICETKRNEKL